MLEPLPLRSASCLTLTETIEELKKVTLSVVRLMERERVRRYGGVPGDLMLIDLSRLQNAVDLLRDLSVGKRCSGGGDCASHSLGGNRT
jgi:hypothetical protein